MAQELLDCADVVATLQEVRRKTSGARGVAWRAYGYPMPERRALSHIETAGRRGSGRQTTPLRGSVECLTLRKDPKPTPRLTCTRVFVFQRMGYFLTAQASVAVTCPTYPELCPTVPGARQSILAEVSPRDLYRLCRPILRSLDCRNPHPWSVMTSPVRCVSPYWRAIAPTARVHQTRWRKCRALLPE